MAYEKAASEQEVFEFLEVAMTDAGCPGEEWALKGLWCLQGVGGWNPAG